jgi:hypothetical protein
MSRQQRDLARDDAKLWAAALGALIGRRRRQRRLFVRAQIKVHNLGGRGVEDDDGRVGIAAEGLPSGCRDLGDIAGGDAR